MKTLFRLAAIPLLLAGLCFGQTATLGNVGVLYDQVFTAGPYTPPAVSIVAGQFSGMNYFKIEFSPLSNSNISACSVFLDSSINGSSFTQGGAISGQTCTSEGSATNGPVSANYVQLDIAVQGQGAVRVRVLGGMSSLAGGGGGGAVSSVGLSLPSGLFSVSGTPVTGSGTLSATFQTIAAHLVLGNNTGSPATAGLVQLGFGDLTGSATVGQLPFTYTSTNSLTKLVTASTFSGTAGSGVCIDANLNLTTSSCTGLTQTWPSGAGIMVYAGGNAFGTSLTAPSSAIVGISDSQTLTNKSIAGSEINSGTVGASYLPAALANSTSINGLSITASTGTLTIAAGKTLTVSNSLTLAGTDSTTQTFPSTSGTVVTSVTTAGGDLSGTYPNPTVAKVNSLSVPASANLVGTNSSSQFVSNTGTISNNTSGTAAGLSGAAPTTALGNGCVQVSSGTFTSTGSSCSSGGGMVYPSGSGFAIVSSGASWGTTLTVPTGAIVGAGQANTFTTGLQQLANATLGLPSSAGYAPTTAALFGYDSTNNRAVLGNGTNTSVLTWITAAPTSLDLPEFSGTLGLLADSSIAVANVVTQTSNGAANKIATYSTTNKVLVPATTLPTAAVPAFTGDCTNSAGALALTCTQINGTAFSGTANDVVAYGSGGNVPLDTSVLYTNLTTQTSNGAANEVCTYTGTNKTCVPGSVANAMLAHSTITINGTTNQITSSTASPALGGSTTIALASPLTFPGKHTDAASTTSASSGNIPSGSAPNSPASGDYWNLSGIWQFYDGTNTNSFTTIQGAVTSGHCPQFSGTAGLLSDSGSICPSISGLGATQVVVASSGSAITSYGGFTSDSSGDVTAASYSVGGSNLNAGAVMLAQPTGTGGAAPTGTNAVGLAGPTTVPTSYNDVFPSAASSGFLYFSTSTSQTGCAASATNMCGNYVSQISLTANVTGILPGANGGTNSQYVSFTGPTGAATFTLPNASATILTNNAAVTVAQGGLGTNTVTLHGFMVGEGTSAVSATAACANGVAPVGQGSSADPICGPLTLTGLTTGFSVAGGTTSKTLSVSNTITLAAGADSQTYTFPAASATIAGLGTTQTFTGRDTFAPAGTISGASSYLTITAPADTGITTATESIGINVAGASRAWVDGTVATQREYYFGPPTYNKTTTSATFTKAATLTVGGSPVAGTGVTITNDYALWVQAGTAQFDGGVVTTSLAATATTNQLVTGAGSNLTTLNFPASSGAVTLTFPITSEYIVGANSDTTTTHVLHATAVAGVFNSTAIAAGDLPSITLDTIANPAAAKTFAGANYALGFSSATTTGSQAAFTLTEASAATGSGDVEAQITTLSGSTSIPLQITQGAAGPSGANAPAVFSISAAAAGGAASSHAGYVGAPINLLTGAGSAGNGASNNGGAGGDYTLATGAGGLSGGASATGGRGGNIYLNPGAGGGANGGTAGAAGYVSVAGSLVATGILDGTAPITISTGTTQNIGTAYSSGYYFNQEGTAGTGVTYTLPATAVGKQYCVQNSGTTSIINIGPLTVYPPASSYVILNGVVNTVGGGGTHGVASSGAAGDSACFVAIDATHWEVFVGKGTWTEN